MNVSCPLCSGSSGLFYNSGGKVFYECRNCRGIFLDKNQHPDFEKEKNRYLTHNNDVNDPGYQKFVAPIVSAILRDFSPEHNGIDYGAGTGPVISKLLRDQNYSIVEYDPFFSYYPELLNSKYDYIACCEVIEHFHYPDREFRLLRNLLNPGGKLYCKTDIYRDDIDFEKWYYKDDPTHVFIYREETFGHIKSMFSFSGLQTEGRLITFTA